MKYFQSTLKLRSTRFVAGEEDVSEAGVWEAVSPTIGVGWQPLEVTTNMSVRKREIK